MPPVDMANAAEIWKERWEQAGKHPWPFVKYFFVTLDQHEPNLKIKLHKPFPARAVFRVLTRAWLDFDVLFLEKCRQFQITWLFSGLDLWEAMTVPGTVTFFQSKKQEDSSDILDRSRHIYSFIHRISASSLFKVPVLKMTGDKLGTKNKLIFPEMKSEIRAIPQGGDIVRMHTLSRLFADETEFQPEFPDAYQAALPTIAGGGRLNSVSTVNGKGFVWEKIYAIDPYTRKSLGEHQEDSARYKPTMFKPPANLTDEEKDYWLDRQICDLPQDEFDAIPFAELVAQLPGLRYWKTAENVDAILLDHWADPDKSPRTVRGRSWVSLWSKAMGRTKWEVEMLRKRDRFKGRPVVLNWNENRFVRSISYDPQSKIYGSADFGTDVCGCFLAQVKNLPTIGRRQLCFIAEIILENSNTPDLARQIIALLQNRFRRSWDYNLLEFYCDPAGHQERETTSDKSENTSIKIFNSYGLFPQTRKFGKPETTQLIETVFDVTLPNGEPVVLIDPSCEYLIRCVSGGLHYPENGRDGYYANNEFTHGGDMLRYMIANIFDEYDVGKGERPAIHEDHYLRQQWTGRIIGLRSRKRPLVSERFGNHAFRSR
jgi:hypothetical protein